MTELRVTVPDDVAERLASEAAERGTSAEDLAADLLRRHVPATPGRSLSFIGMFEGVAGAPSVAELERQLEDGEDDGFEDSRRRHRPARRGGHPSRSRP